MISNYSQRKSVRLESRCTEEQKAIIQKAAILSGANNLTDFTMNILLEKANKIISKHNILSLSLKDQEVFANALLDPKEPSGALIEAKKRYEKEVKIK